MDNRIYDMAMEMLSAVEEVTLGKGFKVLISKDAKKAKECIKEAQRLKRAGNKKDAKEKYDEAIRYYQKIRKEAEKIEDESTMDWVISLCIKPWPFFAAQASYAKFNLKGMTRESTLKIIDDFIRTLKIIKMDL